MNDQQKKMTAVGIFVLVAVVVLYLEIRDPTPAPAPTPVVLTVPSAVTPPPKVLPGVGSAAKTLGSTSARLDPSLHMEAMLVTEEVRYTGTGRNIFAGAGEAPAVAIPKPIVSPRPKPTLPQPVLAQGPPPPPPIDLKFFGTETSAGGKKQAFLLKGEDVFLASQGDIVQRRYRVLLISANSIVVEDLVNNNRQTLPLLSN